MNSKQSRFFPFLRSEKTFQNLSNIEQQRENFLNGKILCVFPGCTWRFWSSQSVYYDWIVFDALPQLTIVGYLQKYYEMRCFVYTNLRTIESLPFFIFLNILFFFFYFAVKNVQFRFWPVRDCSICAWSLETKIGLQIILAISFITLNEYLKTRAK